MFLVGDELQREIGRVLAGTKLRCAVAFWGRGAEDRIPKAQIKNAKLICNLESGGTNPFEISKLIESGAEVRMHPRLHAKVYVSSKGAIVTSANMSANGLGFEGSEQAHWIEAGTSLRETANVEEWFSRLWESKTTEPVTPEALKKAKEAWKLRQRFKPSLPTFADVDVKNCPYLCVWWGDYEARYEEDSIASQLGKFDKAIKKRLDNGIQIEEDDDKILLPGKWVLWWKPDRKRLPVRSSIEWVKLAPVVVKEAFRFEGEPDGEIHDTVPEVEERLPDPFLIDDTFRDLFRELMAEDKYEKLREDDSEETHGWFTDARKKLMKSLWVDLKKAYVQRAQRGGNSS